MGSSTTILTLLDKFPSELLVLVGIWVLLSVFGFTIGASRVHALGLTGIALSFLSPFVSYAWLITSLTGGDDSTWMESFLLQVVIGALLYYMFSRLCDPGFSDGGEMVSAAISALATVAILTAVWSTSFTNLWPFPEILLPLFALKYFFWWIIGSLGVLAIMHQRRL